MRRLSHSGAVTGRSVAASEMRHFFGPFKKKDNDAPAAAAGGSPGIKFPFDLDALAKEVEKSRAEGREPPKWMQGVTHKNINLMKKMLETQNKVSGAVKIDKTSGGPLGSILGKNEDLLKKMIEMNEALVKEQNKANAGTSPDTSSSTPTSGAAPRTLSSDGIDLGPETEELFAELRSMREKKNEMKRQLEAKTRELLAVEADHKEAAAKEKDLRDRLKLAEKDVALLNTEVVDLKDKVRELKPFRGKVQSLESKVKSLEHQDTAPLMQRVEFMEKEVADKDEQLRSANRKLDRARRNSPLTQLSVHLSDITRAAGAQGVAGKTDRVDTAFTTLQQSYAAHLAEDWEASAADLKVYAAVVAASEVFLANRLPYANLDALVSVHGNLTKWKALIGSLGFVAEEVEVKGATEGSKSYRVLGSNAQRSQAIGPFGHLYAVAWYAAQPSNADTVGFRLTKVSPFMSQRILDDQSRTTTRVDTTRSNKPGGQAANVGETNISVKLFVDGELICVSESSDSRSAHENRQHAFQRLYDAKVGAFNETLSNKPLLTPAQLKSEALVAEDAVISKDRWEAMMPAVLNSLPAEDSLIEEAIIKVVEAATTSS